MHYSHPHAMLTPQHIQSKHIQGSVVRDTTRHALLSPTRHAHTTAHPEHIQGSAVRDW